MPEEHIIFKLFKLIIIYQIIFNLLQEIKDGLERSTRSHTIPALSKLLQPLIFSLRFCSKYSGLFLSLLFIHDYANLRCAWYIALVDMQMRCCVSVLSFARC